MLTPTEVIKLCSLTNSTTEKVRFLKENESSLLKECLVYCLNPYFVYGIRQFEFEEPLNHEENSLQIIFELCKALMKREFTGDNARSKIMEVSKKLTRSQQLIFGWILLKDLKAGLADGLVNKAFPGLIPSFEVQLAQPEKFLPKVKFPCLVQCKLDGVRTIAIVDPKEQSVVYYSRNGKMFLNFKCFNKDLLALAGSNGKVFDGEVVGPPGNNFVGIMNQCRRKYDVEPKGLNFYVFDVMHIGNFTSQQCKLNQTDRTDYLYELFRTVDEDTNRVKFVTSYKCNNMEEVEKIYGQFVNEGFEGIIIKDIAGQYEFKRSNAWVKMKPDTTEDLKVIDIQEGTGKYEGRLGAIIVERNGVKINVGSGFKDEERTPVEVAYQNLVGKIVEVKYDSVIKESGSLRFPRFIKLRTDK